MSQDLNHSLDIHSLLKSATKPLHDKIESLNSLNSNSPTIHDYIKFISDTYSIISPLENIFSNKFNNIFYEYNFKPKKEFLISDLTSLGIQVNHIKQAIKLPEIESISNAFGVMYVLEGSTLGGQFIHKKLTAKHKHELDGAMSYLTANGSLTFIRWKEFLMSLEKYSVGNESRKKDILYSAIETFQCFEYQFSSK